MHSERLLAAVVLVPVVQACNHRNDLTDLFPLAFVYLQMVQEDSLANFEPVVAVRSLRMPASALSFLAYFFLLKIEDKGKWRTSRSSRAKSTVIWAGPPLRLF